MASFSDSKDSPEQRAAQTDPSVMYLIVRKSHVASREEFLIAAAHATLDVCDKYAADLKYQSDFEYWSARSFRKVCLRANEKDWEKLAGFDCGLGTVGNEVIVRALPPHRKSQREKLITQLQAYTQPLDELPAREAQVSSEARVMALVVNGDVVMSSGKLAAQIGHAVLMGAGAYAREGAIQELSEWLRAGYPCVVLRANGTEWESIKRDHPNAIVRDAGLTEVAVGSETCLATLPRRRSEWAANLSGLRHI